MDFLGDNFDGFADQTSSENVNGDQYWGNSVGSLQSSAMDANRLQCWDNVVSSSSGQQWQQDAQFYGAANEQNAQFYGSVNGQDAQFYGSASVQDAQFYGSANNSQGSDTNDPQFWENQYPGWKYDYSTGQWYQTEGMDSSTGGQSESHNNVSGGNVPEGRQGDGVVSEQRSEVSYFQHSADSAVEAVAAEATSSNVATWSHFSQESGGYPPNMVFDPQYPGWYYDTNTQQWYSIESYSHSLQSVANTVQNQPSQGNTVDSFIAGGNSITCNEVGQFGNTAQGLYRNLNGNQDQSGSVCSSAKQNMWQPDASVPSVSGYDQKQQTGDFYSLPGTAVNFADQHTSFKMFEPVESKAPANTVNCDQQLSYKAYEPAESKSFSNNNGVTGIQSFIPGESFYQFGQLKVPQTLEAHLSNSPYSNPTSANYPQEQFQSRSASPPQSLHANEGRSSAGRPPHALVSFGFGGKLIVMKDNSSLSGTLDYGSKDIGRGTVSILDLMEVVMDQTDSLSSANDSCNYFHALCRQSFPGPLMGGNAATKDITKWIDEKIAQHESSTAGAQKQGPIRLLLSLLKIACQHYGKLRSPFGSNPTLEESDGPESALSKLFTVSKTNHTVPRDYGSVVAHCLHNVPPEDQLLVTATEVQNLLVSGRRKEALHCAQAGQLWGLALVLAAQLGQECYVDTVKQMAQRQFTSGAPLRTLCLLIAGKPADVFSADDPSVTSLSGASNLPQQSTEILGSMLDDWEENLAIITANRTKDDELVIVHLGDCLWKERGEITSAHICYLVAEATFDSYSDSARLCLIGADHLKCPRTYACPEAIQRTEIYEHSKVLGNSQFVLLQFQPYKLVYANMLAEVGKISDSLRYCQASLKLLKNSGRAPEVEIWKSHLSSLEERLRTYQQGGYDTNLAPAKLVGKLFTSIDRSIHRMMGGPASPLPPMPQSNTSYTSGKENHSLTSSQSTMNMSTLTPSASVEGKREENDNNRKGLHTRSISEPDFSRNPKQEQSKRSHSPESENKTSPSRFGYIGSQLLKTVGWMSRSRQAKLGESNRFYYDEKLKRWVEEGAEPPPEEVTPPPPPPTTASFQRAAHDYNINDAFRSPTLTGNGSPESRSPSHAGHSSGIPPISPGPNHFSSRGRTGVRARYVDTFNKGGSAPSVNAFQSRAVPTLSKPPTGAKFFVPTAPPSTAPASPPEEDATSATKGENIHEADANGEYSTPTYVNGSYSSLSSPAMSPASGTPYFPSIETLASSRNREAMASIGKDDGLSPSHARRASWSGGYQEMYCPNMTEAPRDRLNTPPLGQPVPLHRSSSQELNGRNVGDELQEVAL